MGLHELQNELNNTLSVLRKIQYLINQIDFVNLYYNATDNDKKEADKYIRALNYVSLQAWIKQQRIKTQKYDEIPVKELRIIAQTFGVEGYNYKNKAELVQELLDVDRGPTQ